MLKRNFAIALAVAMVMAALYGCSSNSGVKNDRDMYRERAEELQGQVDTLTAQLATVTGERDQARMDLEAAQGQVTMLQGQISDKDGEISTLTMARDNLQGELNDLMMNGRDEDQMMISNLQGQINMLNSQISTLEGEKTALMGQLETARGTITDLREELAAKTKELNDKLAELAAERAEKDAKAASDTAKELFDVLIPDTRTAVASVSVSASSAGVFEAKATDYAMEAGSPDAISGLRGATLTKDEETIVVYSNIENATATPIGDIYASAAAPGKPKVYSMTETGDSPANTISWGSAKRPDDAQTRTGTGDDTVTTFMGTVRGVAGTFSCTGATGCDAPTKAAIAAHGTTPVSAAGWTFKPDNANAPIDVADDDGYYMFGWWLEKDDDGMPTGVNTFVGVSGLEANTETQATLAAAESATYRGGAAGKYAVKSTVTDTAEGGHFTASATIVANFEAGTGEDEISIRGTIDDFMTGDTARPNWSVELKVANQTGGGALTAVSVTTVDDDNNATWKTGGAVNGRGGWSATFYGMGDDDEPTAVTGQFNATIPNIAKIDGAFGASK